MSYVHRHSDLDNLNYVFVKIENVFLTSTISVIDSIIIGNIDSYIN